MANKSSGRYFVKNRLGNYFTDITTLFDGVAILSVDGFFTSGEPVNIYNEQWVNEQVEDFMITKQVAGSGGAQVPVVVRKNADLDITFIIRQKYAESTINVQAVHDSFISYMTGSDVWVKSAYAGNKYVHCVCKKEYKPTTVKLGRGAESYIMGTLSLHMLESPQT